MRRRVVPCVCAHHALGGVPDAIPVYAIDGDTPLAYNPLHLIETTVFTRQVQSMLSPEEYRALQLSLIARPDAGPIIRGTGGLRKLRWRLLGRGKRGGIRVIYYWRVVPEQILLIYLYPKNVQANLTPAQLRALRRLVPEN